MVLNYGYTPIGLMTKKKHRGISIVSAQVTATVSVTLVLLLLGILAMFGTVTRGLTDDIRRNIGFNIVLADSLPQDGVDALCRQLDNAAYVSTYKYISAQDALDNWRKMTGEDLMEILDVNPFSSAIEVKVTSDYADSDSIKAIVSGYTGHPDIEDVEVPTGLIESVTKSIRSLTFVLSAVALLLLVISFVLINNTVHLTVYARRFTIHTMQLVGATDAFICRPFVTTSLLSGLIAGIAADMIMALIVTYLRDFDVEIAAAVEWCRIIWVFAAVPFAGMLINVLA
ncbi:MAG: permease-like cell division protein FtsX, partial [Muribaculum sp.]|nr:permease-like cell division protein FtsX [Muribaculum sp.]